VDIARDAIRLHKEGKPMTEIRAFIDDYYGRFGAPNDAGPASP
jgi:hypothetical protein